MAKDNEKVYKLNCKKMPKNVRDFILGKQTDIKIANGIQFSMESTLWKIVTSHPDFLKYLSK